MQAPFAAQAARRAPSPDLDLRDSGRRDRPQQGALFDRSFRRFSGRQQVPWKYDQCPHGAAIAPIAVAGDDLVASYACSPRKVLYRGEDVAPAVGQTGDVMTDESLRSRGVFTRLHWHAIESAREAGWPAVWGLPNDSSGRIFFNKLGWSLAGHIGPWNFVLCADGRARRERLVNGRLAAWGAGWAAWRGGAARRRLGPSELLAESLRQFPSAVETLSGTVARRFDWMVRRDAAYLDWRFLRAPSGLFRAFALRDRGGTLCAYVVIQVPRPGSAVGFIGDLVGIDAGAEAAALNHGLGALEAEGACVVRAYAMAGSAWEALLERGGFRAPRGRKPVGAFAIQDDHPLGVATGHTDRWYFTDGDRDDETAR